jgi:hypothetical protein
MLVKDPSATKANKQRIFDNIVIFHLPRTYVKVLFGEWQCKWLITVENPIAEDGDSMLLRVSTVFLLEH